MPKIAKTIKVSVNLPIEEVEIIKSLAQTFDCPMTEVVRRALRTESFMRRELMKGNEIIIRDRNDNMWRVRLPS